MFHPIMLGATLRIAIRGYAELAVKVDTSVLDADVDNSKDLD
jgi:hypothetical protein